MNEIIPSVRLKVVSVSKLNTTPCLRNYFWKYIMNLESRKIYIPFWYGGVLGAGFEALLLGKNYKVAMRKEDKLRRGRCTIDSDTNEELNLQFRLIAAIIEGSKLRPEVKRMKLHTSQIMFKLRLKDSGLLFCGTKDGRGSYRKEGHLFEIKAMTARYVNNAFLDSLTFGKQVNGYTWGTKKLNKHTESKCCCCIFKKPAKRIKKNQTLDDFVAEIAEDVQNPKRIDMYYKWHRFSLGQTTVANVGKDIEREAYILKLLYKDAGKNLLNPELWPKRENKCFEYAGCEFIQLCKNIRSWKMYLRFFQQRQILYPEEQEELS